MKELSQGVIPMKTRFTLSLIACLLATSLVALPSHALRFIKIITPDSKAEEGATVTFKRAKEGVYSFTVTRHNAVPILSEGYIVVGQGLNRRYYTPSKFAPDTPNSDPNALIPSLEAFEEYRAELEVRQGGKLIARTPVAAAREGNNVVYNFELSRDAIKDSRFSVGRNSPVIYEIGLKEIDRRIEAALPQHP